MVSSTILWKCWTRTTSISLWVFCSVPLGSISFVILLWALWSMVDLWKNLVFLSPSLFHCTLDFCLQKISSYWHLLSHSCWSESDCIFFSPVKPFVTRIWLIYCSFLSTSPLDLNIFPNSLWFHSLSFLLMCLSLWCRRNIFVPWVGISSAHHFPMLVMKSGCVSQTFSNLKGLFLGVPIKKASS